MSTYHNAPPLARAQTLADLLQRQSSVCTAEIGFLDSNGTVVRSHQYRDLYRDARNSAKALVHAGLKSDGSDIVVTSFTEHDDHILLFWACCLAGVPLCPIPPFHPDENHQRRFLQHLQQLFHRPTFIASATVLAIINRMVPDARCISIEELHESRNDALDLQLDIHVYPARKPVSKDIVCLMLTSGSTGNSKAVALRHSNLLSSISGKAKHHGSNTNSRFLNWIAFDHVACVSEVHLQALFLGCSQYHVSPSAIIANPRRLLDWSSRLRITYTFSPNFLLAQICRDVTLINMAPMGLDLSNVQAFISGGEVVPNKTAIEFANLIEKFGAGRNVLRAGFGMTETGAGCVYDTRSIPRDITQFQKDIKYLSLGTCCSGTIMRIVNLHTGQPIDPSPVSLAVPQTGLLQISGPTVFHEYYRDAYNTSKSFTSDGWFETGDLAQIHVDDHGNSFLYMMGRDKDIININGVKYGSVDAEHYIEDTQIDGLAHGSFVYVAAIRLDSADTETYAVFYRHATVTIGTEVEILGDDELAALRQTNSFIKTASAVFCSQAPHIVLPLPDKYFVKTALGKVSRSALAKAYMEKTFSFLEEQLTGANARPKTYVQNLIEPDSVDKAVCAAVQVVFGCSEHLTGDENIFDFGASSIQLMQLKNILQEVLNLPTIPTIEILKRPSLRDLSAYLRNYAQTYESLVLRSYDPLVCLSAHGTQEPLFLVHPGVGEVLVFMNLARVLSDDKQKHYLDRPIYAIRARGFNPREKPFKSFDEMVHCYTEAIEGLQQDGPYYIGGYSFGGAIAVEIAKRLERKEKDVAFVGIFNLPPYIQFRMKELSWIEVTLNLFLFLSLFTTESIEQLKPEIHRAFPDVQDEEPYDSNQIIGWLFKHPLCDQERLAELKFNAEEGAGSKSSNRNNELCRWTRVAYNITCTGRTYEPGKTGKLKGAFLTVFCAMPLKGLGTREEFKVNRLSAWKEFASERFEMIDVDGEHYTMLLEDHVESFAEKLKTAITHANGCR